VDAYDPGNWAALFGAEISASAALTGLIFVAVSINLARILEFAALPPRVLKAVLMLVFVLIVSTLVLVPGQPHWALGIELIVLGLGIWLSIALIDLQAWRITDPEYRRLIVAMITLTALAGATTIVSGATLIAMQGGGLYWLVPAILIAFSAALIDAWVLLIEIVR
jgi:modulator of FtsH protease